MFTKIICTETTFLCPGFVSGIPFCGGGFSNYKNQSSVFFIHIKRLFIHGQYQAFENLKF